MTRFFSSSIIVAALYAAFGYYFGGFGTEHLLLASVVVIMAGLLPDIDGSDEMPSRELAGLTAAVSPLVLLEMVPSISNGGLVRIALAVVCCYVLTRLFIFRGLRSVFAPRGMIHSVPAAIIAFQLTYLLFWDLPLYERVFISLAAFTGFFSHLFLEFYLEFDLIGRATGKAKDGPRVLKFFGRSWISNAAIYTTMFVLGWIIAKDLYPNLGVSAQITY